MSPVGQLIDGFDVVANLTMQWSCLMLDHCGCESIAPPSCEQETITNLISSMEHMFAFDG